MSEKSFFRKYVIPTEKEVRNYSTKDQVILGATQLGASTTTLLGTMYGINKGFNIAERKQLKKLNYTKGLSKSVTTASKIHKTWHEPSRKMYLDKYFHYGKTGKLEFPKQNTTTANTNKLPKNVVSIKKETNKSKMNPKQVTERQYNKFINKAILQDAQRVKITQPTFDYGERYVKSDKYKKPHLPPGQTPSNQNLTKVQRFMGKAIKYGTRVGFGSIASVPMALLSTKSVADATLKKNINRNPNFPR
jgi:hypothetical protein